MFLRFFMANLFLALGAFPLQAHDPGLSSAKLTLHNGVLHATLTFAPADIEAICHGDLPKIGSLQALAAQSLAISFDNIQVLPTEAKARLLANKDVEFELSFPARHAARVQVHSMFLDRLPFGHRQYFALIGDNGGTLAEKLLSGSNCRVDVPLGEAVLGAAPPPHPFSEFLGMGVKHILTGYDHLLFLFALLIGCKRISSILKVITAFTVAHSISLALATLGWVEIPSRIVEPLIAATIVYVALDNLIRGPAVSHRVFLTFGFGLVHGFGFASALREMGVGSNGSAVAFPLIGFNTGVEIGQMLVAAVILPLLWRVKEKPQFVLRWAPACSVLIALAGSFWFIQRVWMN